jgi:hypothetical protein
LSYTTDRMVRGVPAWMSAMDDDRMKKFEAQLRAPDREYPAREEREIPGTCVRGPERRRWLPWALLASLPVPVGSEPAHGCGSAYAR